MGKSKGLFNSNISIEQEENNIETELTVDNAIAIQNTTIDMNENEKSIKADIITLEKNEEVLHRLEEQVAENEEKLNEENEITHDDIQTSQETLFYSVASLGYSKSDIMSLRVSHEAFNGDLRTQLVVSTEGIKDVLRKIYETIKRIIIGIFRKLQELAQQFIFWYSNKDGVLRKYKDFCKQHSDVLMPSLDSRQLKKIGKDFHVFLNLLDGEIDFKLLLDYASDTKNNPFIQHMNDFFNYYNNQDNKNDDLEKLLKNVESSTSHSVLQTDLIKYIHNKVPGGNTCGKILYVTYVKESTIKGFVIRNSGLIYETFTQTNGNYEYPLNIKHVKRLGDLISQINLLISNYNNLNGYFKYVLNIHKNAQKSLESTYNDLCKQYNNDINVKQVNAEKAFKIIKDVGSKMVFDLAMQYYHVNSKLFKLVDTIIKTVIEKNNIKI